MKPVLSAGSGYIWSTVLGLAAFLAVIALCYVILRWISKKTVGASSGHMRVVERLAVGQGTCLMLVRVGGRVLALSATKDGLKYLCEVDPSDIGETAVIGGVTGSPREASADTGGGKTARKSAPVKSTFASRFAHNMRIQLGLLPKGTPPARPPAMRIEEDETPPGPRVRRDAIREAGYAVELDENPEIIEAAPPEPAAGASSFALELKKAREADNAGARKENEDLLLDLLEETDPAPKPVTVQDSGQGRDYDTAIERMMELGRIGNTVTPVTPRAAAASSYKAASAPIPSAAPAAPAVSVSPNPVMPMVPSGDGVPPAAAASVRLKEEREKAAQKLEAESKVDELFDRISQRSSRYKKE